MNQLLREMLERASGSARIKSQAMSPLAWFCGILIPSSVVGLTVGPPEFHWAFLALILFAVVLYAGFYAYWAVKDPDRLGSEAFVERSHMIRKYEESKDPRYLSGGNLHIGPDPNSGSKKTKALKP